MIGEKDKNKTNEEIANKGNTYEYTYNIYDATNDNSLAAQMTRDMIARLQQLEIEKEKTKANGIYGNPLSDSSLAAQLSRDKVAEIEREQTKLLAKYYGIKTEGKTNDQIIKDMAGKVGLNLTKTIETTVPGTFEMPYFNQQLYEEGWICCAACTAAQIASWGLGRVVDPHEFETTIPFLKTGYRAGKGTGNDWLWKLNCWKQYNLEYYTGKFEDSSNLMQSHEIDKVVEIIKEGGIVALLAKENIFTTGGHYLTVYGVVEDEKGTRLLIIDPDGDKLTPYGEKTEYGKNGRGKEEYMDYLENGFPIEMLRTMGGCSYYGFKKIDENRSDTPPETTYIDTNKTPQELLDELIKGTNGKESSNETEKVTINKGAQTQEGNAIEKREEPDKIEMPQSTLPQTGASGRGPRYNQLDYADTPYGGSNVAKGGCGITCVAEYLTRTTSQKITPNELAVEFSGSADNNQDRMLNALDANGVQRGAWNSGGDKRKMVLEALKNGKSVLVQMNSSSKFTTTEHFIILEGMTEDGKVLVYDPYGDNYKKDNLKEGYKNGFDVDDVMKGLGGGCVLERNING